MNDAIDIREDGTGVYAVLSDGSEVRLDAALERRGLVVMKAGLAELLEAPLREQRVQEITAIADHWDRGEWLLPQGVTTW